MRLRNTYSHLHELNGQLSLTDETPTFPKISLSFYKNILCDCPAHLFNGKLIATVRPLLETKTLMQAGCKQAANKTRLSALVSFLLVVEFVFGNLFSCLFFPQFDLQCIHMNYLRRHTVKSSSSFSPSLRRTGRSSGRSLLLSHKIHSSYRWLQRSKWTSIFPSS